MWPKSFYIYIFKIENMQNPFSYKKTKKYILLFMLDFSFSFIFLAQSTLTGLCDAYFDK